MKPLVGPISNNMHHLHNATDWDRWQIFSPLSNLACFLKSLYRSRFWSRMSNSPLFYPSSKSQTPTPQVSLHTCEPSGTSCQQMAQSQVLSCLKPFCYNPKHTFLCNTGNRKSPLSVFFFLQQFSDTRGTYSRLNNTLKRIVWHIRKYAYLLSCFFEFENDWYHSHICTVNMKLQPGGR